MLKNILKANLIIIQCNIPKYNKRFFMCNMCGKHYLKRICWIFDKKKRLIRNAKLTRTNNIFFRIWFSLLEQYQLHTWFSSKARQSVNVVISVGNVNMRKILREQKNEVYKWSEIAQNKVKQVTITMRQNLLDIKSVKLLRLYDHLDSWLQPSHYEYVDDVINLKVLPTWIWNFHECTKTLTRS